MFSQACAFTQFAQLFERMRELGKLVLIIGVLTTFVGLVMWSGFAPKWLGRLPGDIRIEREHSSFYLPIVTCIILSIVLSLLLSIFSIFRRGWERCENKRKSTGTWRTCCNAASH